MKRIILLLLVSIMILLSACAKPATSTPEVTTTQPAQNPLSIPTMSEVPVSWTDRSIFRSGLVSSQQTILDQLPGATVYHIEVVIDPGYTSLHGIEQVLYTNREDTTLDEIYFQLFPNMEGGSSTISNLLVDGQSVSLVYEIGNSSLKVSLPAPLAPGKDTQIQMDFAVTVPTQTAGNYGLFAYVDDLLALDGFYPAIPVYDAKGWHKGLVPPNSDTTFQDASFYVVKVTAPKSLILASAGVQLNRTTSENFQTVTFVAGPARDFYLAGSEKYVVTSDTVGETIVNAYTLKDRKEGAQWALETAVNALGSYSERFGEYPYSEFDIVSIPMDGAYGIEYPGITGINQALFDTEASLSGVPTTTLLESTVAHEAAHQWFYNLVGNDQANEPWLDEAVAQYVTGLYFKDRCGVTGWEGYSSSWSSRWDRVGREDLPIGLPAGDYQGKEYGAIVYGRGPMFLAALAEKMGQKSFDAFLLEYVQQHEWGIATTADFKTLAEKQCACDLTEIFDKWVYTK